MSSAPLVRELQQFRFLPRLLCLVCAAGSLSVPRSLSAAELDARTVAAYDRYISEVTQAFARRTVDEAFLDFHTPEALARMRGGEILLTAGRGDGITDVPKGLIHHWRGAAFVPDITLERLLTIVQDYSAYADVYDWVIASQLVAREGNRFRSFFRIKRSAGVVTGVVDMWMVTDYRRIENNRAIATAQAECVRQVEHAGEQDERRLRQGTGSGYVWRAAALSKYLERDGGVYIELDTIGLSRGFPPLLGWIVEPIARRLGRESAGASLNQLRTVVRSSPAPGHARDDAKLSAPWCGE